MSVLFIVIILFLGWLLLDGLLTGEIWVKGGASDRFTRSLDMESFAHKVHKKDNPNIYWFFIVFYLAAILFITYVWIAE